MLGTRHLKQFLPWQAKIGFKLVLSRLPTNYRIWQSLALFRHGKMDQPEYALRVFRFHKDRCAFGRKGQPFVALELGPGDSLFSALVGKALGAEHTWLVDVGDFALNDPEPYRRMARYLTDQGLTVPEIPDDLAQMLASCGASYCTRGLESLRAIPSGTVDLVFSHAVLEHIRKAEFLPLMRELRRVLRKDGMCSHRVDLRDHLSGALNNLRFPTSIWEADWMANSGFYTNRIQFDEMCRLFEAAGFHVDASNLARWPELPVPRRSLATPFRELSTESLTVKSFDVILRPIED